MRVFIFFFILVMSMISCNNNSYQKVQNAFGDHDATEKYELDTLKSLVQEDVSRLKEKTSASVGSSSSSSESHNSDSYDNMRGFDPASEDDMDDNGMSRYMENNDDEGWD